jgi:hypothetical protein
MGKKKHSSELRDRTLVDAIALEILDGAEAEGYHHISTYDLFYSDGNVDLGTRLRAKVESLRPETLGRIVSCGLGGWSRATQDSHTTLAAFWRSENPKNFDWLESLQESNGRSILEFLAFTVIGARMKDLMKERRRERAAS